MFKKYVEKINLLNFLWLILFFVSLLFCVQFFNLSITKRVEAEEKILPLKDGYYNNNIIYKPYIFGWDNFLLKSNKNRKNIFEKKIDLLVNDYPIKEMTPYISRYNWRVVGLIIGIAKKESNWGKRAPSKNGKTCYNYWGYKGRGSRGFSKGYGCFSTPKEAVDIIGRRIQELVHKGLETPEKMIVWKCGNSCSGHSAYSVKKWISDVSLYYDKIKQIKS